MSRKILFVLAFVALFAIAAGNKVRTGSRINVRTESPTAYPADTAFHVEHGWNLNPGETKGKGKYDVALYVDGVFVKSDFSTMTKNGGGTMLTWVHNFPDGLPAGEHSLTVEWYGPCQFVGSGGCASPNQKVMAFSRTVVVTFGP